MRPVLHSIRIGVAIAAAALFVVPPPAQAIQVVYSPSRPTFNDVIVIEIRDCLQPGTLHWGVNARDGQWEEANEVYRPGGSWMDGKATRTPLDGPAEGNVCRIQLGPFNHTNQFVTSVDFAIQWQNQSWENFGGRDFHIAIGPERITFSPTNPTLNDLVVVTVHDSLPGGELHWGVNEEIREWRPPHTSYWPAGTYILPGGTGANTPLPPPDEKGDSVITLGPFNRGEQVVHTVQSCVRWGSEWDTDFGRNYNLTISTESRPGEPRVTVYTPAEEETLHDELPVEVSVENGGEVELWLDGEQYAVLTEPPFTRSRPLLDIAYGRHHLVARTARDGKVGMDEVSFWRAPRIETVEVPAGLARGATIEDDGNVSFLLHAPGKRFVSLVGSFNQWNPAADVMHPTLDGNWWLRRHLPDGTNYYQYVIDGSRYLADPYSRDVEWKDEKGREHWRGENARSVLEIPRKEYAWKSNHYRRPPLEELVIYEFFIEDFCPGQGFTGVIARLDYIEQLGVNAIEPLPVTEFPGATGWGYNPAFHFAPETTYGTPEELKRLIDECHQRGIAVILDMVLNHMEWQSPLYQLYRADYEASPYFYLFLGENWGFPDLEQQSEEFKRYASDAIGFWLREYRVDGFRYDATRWVGWQGYNDWGASWFAYAGKQADPGSIQIAEHLPADPDLMNQTPMDSGWHDYIRWRLREMLSRGELDAGEFERIMNPLLIGFTNAYQRVAYVESHDEERVPRELMHAGYSFDEAILRSRTAAAVILTTPGIPMLYSGQEFAEIVPKRVGPSVLSWHKLELPTFSGLRDSLSRLVKLRTSEPALRSHSFELLINNEQSDVAAYARHEGDSHVVTVVNFSRYPQEVSIEWPAGGVWNEALSGESRTVTAGQRDSLGLRPGDAGVWRLQSATAMINP